MLSYLRKRWNYLLAKLNLRHEETADPKVQLEQAISEAKDQHRRLREQAANVVANQKQTEMRINDALEKLEKTNTNARQAVLMAEEAAARGDAGKVDQYTSAAQQFADRLLVLEEEIESLKGSQMGPSSKKSTSTEINGAATREKGLRLKAEESLEDERASKP